MTDDIENGTGTSIELVRVPKSVTEFLQPKPSGIITEAANFLRAHWEEVRPFYASIAGVETSIHGSLRLDEAACVFAVQHIAKTNGFAFLGSVKAEQLRKALRRAYKRNTGIAVRQLEKQNIRLRLERKAASAAPDQTDVAD